MSLTSILSKLFGKEPPKTTPSQNSTDSPSVSAATATEDATPNRQRLNREIYDISIDGLDLGRELQAVFMLGDVPLVEFLIDRRRMSPCPNVTHFDVSFNIGNYDIKLIRNFGGRDEDNGIFIYGQTWFLPVYLSFEMIDDLVDEYGRVSGNEMLRYANNKMFCNHYLR